MVPSSSCRRQDERIPQPIEIHILEADRSIPAIVRDLSYSREDPSQPRGVGILHHEPLTPGRVVDCRTVQVSPYLPETFRVDVRWSRCFDQDAFISGGLIVH